MSDRKKLIIINLQAHTIPMQCCESLSFRAMLSGDVGSCDFSKRSDTIFKYRYREEGWKSSGVSANPPFGARNATNKKPQHVKRNCPNRHWSAGTRWQLSDSVRTCHLIPPPPPTRSLLTCIDLPGGVHANRPPEYATRAPWGPHIEAPRLNQRPYLIVVVPSPPPSLHPPVAFSLPG